MAAAELVSTGGVSKLRLALIQLGLKLVLS